MAKKIVVNAWNDTRYSVRTIQPGIPDDLFISCVSYEPRTLGILRKLASDFKAGLGLFAVNERFEKFNQVQENKEAIDAVVTSSSLFDKSKCLQSSIDNPIKLIIEMDKMIKKVFPGRRRLDVTLDITTFPRGQLLTVIYYLRHLPILGSLRILYVSPQKYGDWLSEGYLRSMIPPFFEGPPTFRKKTALFLLTGFEYNRALSLIDDLEPSAVIVGRPKPGTSDEFRDISEEIVHRLRRTRKVVREIHDIPANDPLLCRDSLEEIMEKHSQSYNFYLAILGTKLQILGAYLAYEAHAQNPDFRIIYPIPLIYNVGDYSSGCRDVYETLLTRSTDSQRLLK